MRYRIRYKSSPGPSASSVSRCNTQHALTCRMELSTSVLSGDSSARLLLRMRFLALCTMLDTDSLWMGTDAGSVSLDSAWVMSLFSTETTPIITDLRSIYTARSDSGRVGCKQINSLCTSVNQRTHPIRRCSVIRYIEHALQVTSMWLACTFNTSECDVCVINIEKS